MVEEKVKNDKGNFVTGDKKNTKLINEHFQKLLGPEVSLIMQE